MACIPIKEFADKNNLKIRTVYNLIAKNKHLKKKVPGRGTLISEEKYQKLIA